MMRIVRPGCRACRATSGAVRYSTASAGGALTVTVPVSSDRAPDGQGIVFHALGNGRDAFALGGQRPAPAAPINQRDAEGCFQRRDAAGDRGVLDAERPRGGGQRAGRCQRGEMAEIVPIHRSTFSWYRSINKEFLNRSP